MKKARPERASVPSRRSLRELPETDFARYTIRPNRFAMRAREQGIELLHDGPSAASLAAIPEVDLASARPRRRGRVTYVQIGRGRPPRGAEVGPTSVRSIRLPDDVWRALEVRARREGLTVHALLRSAIVSYLVAPMPAATPARRRASTGTRRARRSPRAA